MNIFETIYRQLLTEAEFVASKTNVANPELNNAQTKRIERLLKKQDDIKKARAKLNQTGLIAGQKKVGAKIYDAKGNWTGGKNTTELDKLVGMGAEAKHRTANFVKTGINALKQYYNRAKGDVANLHRQKWVRNNPTTAEVARKNLIGNIFGDWKKLRGEIQVGGASNAVTLIIVEINKELKLKKPFRIYLGKNEEKFYNLQHPDFATKENPEGFDLAGTMGEQQVNGWHMAGYCAVGYAIVDFCVENNIDLKDKHNPVSQYYNAILNKIRSNMNSGSVPYTPADLYEFIQTESSKQSELAKKDVGLHDPKEQEVITKSAMSQLNNDKRALHPFKPQEGNLTTGLAVKKD